MVFKYLITMLVIYFLMYAWLEDSSVAMVPTVMIGLPLAFVWMFISSSMYMFCSKRPLIYVNTNQVMPSSDDLQIDVTVTGRGTHASTTKSYTANANSRDQEEA